MAYDDERVKLSRVPNNIVALTMVHCSLTFGTAPCVATGEPCYNTYKTCKDRTNFAQGTRVYSFSKVDTPLPLRTGERPYVKSVDYLPTEIKDELAVKGRVTISFFDEPDQDYSFDPNYAARSSTSKTKTAGKSYFKKFFSRYDNWHNSQIEVYEGFTVATNLSTENFKRKFVGKIQSVDFDANEVDIEAVDYLDKLSGALLAEEKNIIIKHVGASGTRVKIKRGIEEFTTGSSGLIRIDDEILHFYTANIEKRRLLIDGRGLFQTDAKIHEAGVKLTMCRYLSGNPFDLMTTLLTSVAEIPTTSIDTAAFARMKALPGREPYMMTVLTETIDAEDLYKELLKLTECRSWVNENQQITVGRGFLKNTTYDFPEISDSANIIEGSEDLRLVNNHQITYAAMHWDAHIHANEDTGGEWVKNPGWRFRGLSSAYWVGYNQLAVHTDTLAESTLYLGKRSEEIIYCRWLHTSLSYPSSQAAFIGLVASDLSTASSDLGMYNADRMRLFADGFVRRYVSWRAQPEIQYQLDVEMKDSTLQVGDQILVSGDIFLDATGANIDKRRCFIRKKEPQDDYVQTLSLVDYGAWTAFVAPDSQVNYASAASSELQYGFLSDTNYRLPDGKEGYTVY